MNRDAPFFLVLGGAGSGKTAHALAWAEGQGARRLYLATARLIDQETARKAAAHQRERGPGWLTVEEPMDPASALAAHADKADVVLVDCLGMWVTNLLCAGLSGAEVETRGAELAKTLAANGLPTAVVGNETGLGMVPEYPLGRAFQQASGRVNQIMAQTARRVDFMVAGLAMKVK